MIKPLNGESGCERWCPSLRITLGLIQNRNVSTKQTEGFLSFPSSRYSTYLPQWKPTGGRQQVILCQSYVGTYTLMGLLCLSVCWDEPAPHHLSVFAGSERLWVAVKALNSHLPALGVVSSCFMACKWTPRLSPISELSGWAAFLPSLIQGNLFLNMPLWVLAVCFQCFLGHEFLACQGAGS